MSNTLKEMLKIHQDLSFEEALWQTRLGFSSSEHKMMERRIAAIKRDPQTLEIIESHGKNIRNVTTENLKDE